MKRYLPLAALLALSDPLFCFVPAPVQIPFTQSNHNQTAILCTNLPNNGPKGELPLHLYEFNRTRSDYFVQTGFVQGQETGKEERHSVMFWNVENFFDWRNDSTTVSDLEFSPAGERHWTWKRFQAKANAFAKALFWVEEETGRLPDIVGLEEVENAFVLRLVLQKTALRKTDYKYVHYDSPDRRGIDVALLYRSSALELLDSKPCHLYEADSLLATRDILLCVFRRKPPGTSSVIASSPPVIPDTSSVIPDTSHVFPGSSSVIPVTAHVIPGLTGNLPHDGSKMTDYVAHDGKEPAFAVLVNHHPSKYGGAAESEPRRRIAVERLRFLADSLAGVGIDLIIAGGDFNDTPDNPVFRLLEPALMPLHMDLFHRGQGTIKYDGKWDLIDHIYVSPGWSVLSGAAGYPSDSDRSGPPSHNSASGLSMRILRIPFLLARDNVHAGQKPLRTYTGPRHTAGVSDHLPVLLEITFPP